MYNKHKGVLIMKVSIRMSIAAYNLANKPNNWNIAFLIGNRSTLERKIFVLYVDSQILSSFNSLCKQR